MFTKKTREVAMNVVADLKPIGSFERAVSEMASEVLLDEGDFYERDFYCLSNFSSFNLLWKGIVFDTSEHAYHWEKFNTDQPRAVGVQNYIATSCVSAHEAYEVALRERAHRRRDWDAPSERPVKVQIMKQILREKYFQHEYVRKKLKQASDRQVVLTERSWRDSFWGTGPDGDGEDWMGRLWSEIMVEEVR